MSDSRALKVVLCWHMHQPDYRDPVTGTYRLPWTYLHGVKDYVDMAAHLEAVPEARAVVNFTPTLLEQIDDYAAAIGDYLRDGGSLPDPLLDALGAEELPSQPEARLALIHACLRANKQRLVDRFPVFQQLVDLGRWIMAHPEHVGHITDQYIFDLLTWYHLAWLAETVRREDAGVRALQASGRGFAAEQRRDLLALIGELLSAVVPRYRALAEQGRIELSVTPYAHPILPLLLNLESAHEATPQLPLPEETHYPGGAERAQWHVDEAVRVFEAHFGFRPRGCWPAEGSVCERTLELLERAGFRWAASGGQVLRNSIDRYQPQHDGELLWGHRAYGIKKGVIRCFFRDDGLSDSIGFRYSTWHADDAVANLIHNLENIAEACRETPESVVSIVLDGENAWEYYPENGYHFLRALYEKLSAHPGIELTTFSDCLDKHATVAVLPGLVAGSWVHGTFTTWVGHADKNRAWDMLSAAKLVFDEMERAGSLSGEHGEQVRRQLAICEGSDWFWWFGDENPAAAVRDFDELYRIQLRRLYELLDHPAPEYLSRVFTHGGGAPLQGGVMRPGVEVAT